MAKFKVYCKSEEFIIEADRLVVGPTGEMCLQDVKYSNVAVFPAGSVVINVETIKDE